MFFLKSEKISEKIKGVKKNREVDASYKSSSSNVKIEQPITVGTNRQILNARKPQGKGILGKYSRSFSDQYAWFTNLFAIQSSNFKGDKSSIVAKLDGFVFFKSESKPDDSFYIVESIKNKEIGIYLGKILIIQKKSEVFESDVLKIAAGRIKSNDIQYLSGVYIVSSPNISNAFQLITALKQTLDLKKIDIDAKSSFDNLK